MSRMKLRYKLLAALLTIPLVTGAGYHLLTPRATLVNLSDTDYVEFVVALPSNRISFSPVAAGSASSIYYTRQKQAGMSTFSLTSQDQNVVEQRFLYAEGNELGRILRFTIDREGHVTIASDK